MFVLMVCIFLVACNGTENKFDQKLEQERATKVMNSVLTSFKEEEKLAEAKTSDEANQIAWEKIKEKNVDSLSDDLNEKDESRLLYLLTTNKAEDLSNGGTKANLLFSQDTKNKNVSFNESAKSFTFDIERSGFDHKLITLEKQEDKWKIVKVADPE